MPRLQPGPRSGHKKRAGDVPVGTWEPRLRLWVDIRGRGSLGPGKLRLLEAIADTKSLSAAAKKVRMSYRLAWQHVQQIEERTGITVVEPHRGGRRGGGTDLTKDGQVLLKAFREFRADVEEHLRAAFQQHLGGRSSPKVPDATDPGD